jgi:hypothetical protein
VNARPAFVWCAVVAALTGCGHVRHRVVTHHLPPVVTSPTPQPARTVVHAFPRQRAGESAVIHAQAGVGLRVTVSRPSVSRTSLSSTHGYPPQHGHYVTFHVAVANTGSKPVDLSPRDFSALIAHQGRVSTYDGNSPYSGADKQLDPTELEPGDTVHGPLTFDVRSTHGRFDYRPGGATVAEWTF